MDRNDLDEHIRKLSAMATVARELCCQLPSFGKDKEDEELTEAIVCVEMTERLVDEPQGRVRKGAAAAMIDAAREKAQLEAFKDLETSLADALRVASVNHDFIDGVGGVVGPRETRWHQSPFHRRAA
jgi:hypothetical protein